MFSKSKNSQFLGKSIFFDINGDIFLDFPIKMIFEKTMQTWTFLLENLLVENIFEKADIPNIFSLAICIFNLAPDCQQTTFIIAKCKEKTET